MTADADQFDNVLTELRGLLAELQMLGVEVVLVGGQVLSVESRATGGDGVIEVRTDNELVIQRGYSMEPDLLFDVDAVASRVDAITDVFRSRGFRRVKSYRWEKSTPKGAVQLDAFIPPDANDENNPAGFTRLPAGDLALLHPRSVQVHLPTGAFNIDVPDPVAFLAMKLVAKRELRPEQTKDSFDMFAYVSLKGTDVIAAALASDEVSGPTVASQLRGLFADTNADGVKDVLAYAGALLPEQTALLARAVVDRFDDLERTRLNLR